MEAKAKKAKKHNPWLIGAGALFASWNAAVAVDTAYLVYQLNNENKFEKALPLRLAEQFKTSTEYGSSDAGAATIDAVGITASVLGVPGVLAGHTAGVLLFGWD